MRSERVRTIIIAVVTVVWAANFVAGLVLPKYESDQAINAIFMAIVGGLFAVGVKRDADESKPPPSARDDEVTP